MTLLVDELEKSLPRMLEFATVMGIPAEHRQLPAGDYVWILKHQTPHQQQHQTKVFSLIVERKSWDDLNTSLLQIINMQKSRFPHKFLRIEGSCQDMVTKPTGAKKTGIE